MDASDFEIYSARLKEKSGIVLVPEKTYLLESRLIFVAKKYGLGDISALAKIIQSDPDGVEMNDVVEAMATNETRFFRDKNAFAHYAKICLPYLQQARGEEKIKIWSAAAASGQEPYSLSMFLEDQKESQTERYDILATDISRDVLAIAKKGIYSQFDVQRGLPIRMLLKHFTQQEEMWQINAAIRSTVQYQQLNLMASFSDLGEFDVIFCRNVLVHFDDATKKDIVQRLAKQMAPDGFLFLDPAETILDVTDIYAPLSDMRGVYVLKDAPHAKKTEDAHHQSLAS